MCIQIDANGVFLYRLLIWDPNSYDQPKLHNIIGLEPCAKCYVYIVKHPSTTDELLRNNLFISVVYLRICVVFQWIGSP